MPEPVTLGTALIALGGVAIGGVLGNRADWLAVKVLSDLRSRWVSDGALPQNQDLERAAGEAFRLTLRSLYSALREHEEPNKQVASRGLKWLIAKMRASLGTGDSPPASLSQSTMPAHLVWIRELGEKTKSDGELRRIPLQLSVEEFLALSDSAPDSAFEELLSRALDAWMAKEVRRGAPPDYLGDWLASGWPVQEHAERATPVAVYCLFLSEILKEDDKAFRALLLHIERDARSRQERAFAHHTKLLSALRREGGALALMLDEVLREVEQSSLDSENTLGLVAEVFGAVCRSEHLVSEIRELTVLTLAGVHETKDLLERTHQIVDDTNKRIRALRSEGAAQSDAGVLPEQWTARLYRDTSDTLMMKLASKHQAMGAWLAKLSFDSLLPRDAKRMRVFVGPGVTLFFTWHFLLRESLRDASVSTTNALIEKLGSEGVSRVQLLGDQLLREYYSYYASDLSNLDDADFDYGVLSCAGFGFPHPGCVEIRTCWVEQVESLRFLLGRIRRRLVIFADANKLATGEGVPLLSLPDYWRELEARRGRSVRLVMGSAPREALQAAYDKNLSLIRQALGPEKHDAVAGLRSWTLPRREARPTAR